MAYVHGTFLIDDSGSMGGQKCQTVQQCLKEIVQNVLKGNDRVTVRLFGSQLKSALYDGPKSGINWGSICSAITGSSGGTRLFYSIIDVLNEILGLGSDSNCRGQFMAVLTDGEDDEGDARLGIAQDAVTNIRLELKRPFRFYLIGVGISSNYEQKLANMCSATHAEYRSSTSSPDDIKQAFRRLGDIVNSIRISGRHGGPKVSSGGCVVGNAIHIKPKQYQVYVAVDFGTWGTGYAYVFPDEPTKIYSYQKWPGQDDVSVKTLTNILLDKKGKCLAFGTKARDDYQEMEEDETVNVMFFEKFKMALYETDEKDESEYKGQINIKRRIKASNVKREWATKKVIIEAMKYIKKHVMQEFEDQGMAISDENVKWLITVPAIWTDTGKTFMLQCAYQAKLKVGGNMDQVDVALEPECAAIWARRQMSHVSLKKGDKYIVLDCGGGTIDVACHEVIDKVRVKEVLGASGGPWGSTYIDKKFELMLELVFGVDVMAEIRETLGPLYTELISECFENQKKQVSIEDRVRRIRLPYEIDEYFKNKLGLQRVQEMCANFQVVARDGQSHTGVLNYKRGLLVVKKPVWEWLFMENITNITNHCQKLLETPEMKNQCECIFIVGGFGNSEFIVESVKHIFPNVFVPPNPDLAVLSGASVFAIMPSLIQARKVRFTYGLKYQRDALPTDDATKVRRDDYLVQNVVDDAFYTFVKKGDEVDHDETLTQKFQSTGDECVEIILFQSTCVDPKYTSEPHCKKIGQPIKYKFQQEGQQEIAVHFKFGETNLKVVAEDHSGNSLVQHRVQLSVNMD